MAHECPECGCRCFCHGDIDDCVCCEEWDDEDYDEAADEDWE